MYFECMYYRKAIIYIYICIYIIAIVITISTTTITKSGCPYRHSRRPSGGSGRRGTRWASNSDNNNNNGWGSPSRTKSFGN